MCRFFFLFLMTLLPVLQAQEVTPQQFTQWWAEFRTNSAVPEDLKEMEDYFVSSEMMDRCSKFWLFLNKMNIEQITSHGYLNFKQTVACNYFTWVVDSSHDYGRNLYSGDLSFLQTIPEAELSKKHDFFTQEQSNQYNRTTVLLYDFLMRNGGGPFLEKLDEPFFGNPPSIQIGKHPVSQDVLNSLMEYISMANHCEMSKVSTVLEVGAGSGRTAYCFLKLNPSLKYIVVDIPPALYLSQTFLSQVFSERKIFRFRPFTDFEEVREEFLSSDIIFITPDQLLKLPSKSVDLFMAIDCLHEMKKEEVQLYFTQADRLASLFYFKCWNTTVVPFDNVAHDASTYPVPTSWQKIFEGGCYVPSGFFHAFYNCN